MPVVVQTRGEGVEAIHPFVAAVVRGHEVVGRHDAPGVSVLDVTTTWRSASKPFQLVCALEALSAGTVLGAPGETLVQALSPEDLAVGAASHSGEPAHLERVRSLLARFGRVPEDLRCGAHPPVHTPSAEAVLRAGADFTDLHNNCSGKHSFMLGACTALGWPLDYRPVDHPLQVRIRAHLEALCQVQGAFAVDGCGVPTWHMPVVGLARAWARLAEAVVDDAPATLARVGRAMMAHPELTSGTDRLDLQVVRGARVPLAVKIGAQGVFCIAVPSARLGIAIKVLSGNGDALPAAIVHVLRAAVPGAFEPSADWAPFEVRNVVGRVVGRFEVDARP